ncbi:unnamed protein product [Fusarium langsethiae]|nr:unnamed protein product [Fusarium langsethiae]
MNNTRDELRNFANEQLVLAEGRRPVVEKSKKRAREVEDINSTTSGARRPKLDGVDATITSQSHFQPPNEMDPPQPPPLIGHDAPTVLAHMPSATALIPGHNTAESVAIANFANPSEGLYSNSIAGSTPLDNFDAYVHQLINFPESWRTGHLSS